MCWDDWLGCSLIGLGPFADKAVHWLTVHCNRTANWVKTSILLRIWTTLNLSDYESLGFLVEIDVWGLVWSASLLSSRLKFLVALFRRAIVRISLRQFENFSNFTDILISTVALWILISSCGLISLSSSGDTTTYSHDAVLPISHVRSLSGPESQSSNWTGVLKPWDPKSAGFWVVEI